MQVASSTDAAGVRIELSAARKVRGLQLVLIAPAGATPRLEANELDARLEKLDDFRSAIVLPEVPAGASELRVSF